LKAPEELIYYYMESKVCFENIETINEGDIEYLYITRRDLNKRSVVEKLPIFFL
jgi:hypothetical protein